MQRTQFSFDRPARHSPRSLALTAGLAESGARALAIFIVPAGLPKRPRLVGASAGASAGFADMCLALAEAPAGAALRQIEVVGMGRLSWKAIPVPDRAEEMVVFALYGETLGCDHEAPALDAALDFSRFL